MWSVSTLHGQDGLQNIRLVAPRRITMVHTMRLRRTIREVTYDFEDLRDLLAKASPYRSGDALAGIAAESGEQRAAAQMTLADLPLQAFLRRGAGALRERRSHPPDSRHPRSGCLSSVVVAYRGRFSRLAALRCRDGRDAGCRRAGVDSGDGGGCQQVDAGAGPDPGGAQDTRGHTVQDDGRTRGKALYAAAAEPSPGRPGRDRGVHDRWPAAWLREMRSSGSILSRTM